MVPNPPPAAPASDTDDAPIWLRAPDDLSYWQAASSEALAVDTEFVRERTYWPRLALIQIADRECDGLIDPIDFEPLTVFGELLANAGRTVLMHSGGEDLIALRPILPGPMLGLYDTQLAAAYAGHGLGLGYQALTERLLGVSLGKQETRSDWLARPLSAKQIRYARDDVRYLCRVYDQLDPVLVERGYREWLVEDCRRLALQQFSAEADPQPQLAFRGLWRWPLPAQAQLRRILIWREQAARERNLPRRWVLDDDGAVAAATEPEHSAARLAARLADGPAGRRRSLQALLNLLERLPDESEIVTTVPIPAPLERELKHTVTGLKAEVEAEARRLDLPSGLLCPRRALESLARGQGWPAELTGWRSTLLLPKLG